MKLSKKITLTCLLLSIALLFGSCSLLSKPFSNESSNETANKNTELEKQQQDKQSEIVKLKETLKEQGKKAADERAKCNELVEDTKRLPGNKNPESIKDAPNTVAKCKDATTAENQVKDTKNKLEATEKDLAETQEKIKQLPPDTSNYGWLISLLVGVAEVLGLALLLGGSYMMVSKKIDKAIATEHVLNQQSFDRIKSKHNKFNELFAEYGKVMNDLERLVKLQQGKIEILEFKIKDKTTISSASYPAVIEQKNNDYPDEVNVLEQKLREKDNDFKEMVDELIQTVRLQQGKIEELEFKIKKGDERTK